MNVRPPLVDPASIKESVDNLSQDLGELFRAELDLFKREAKQELRGVVVAGIWLGAGALVGLAALVAITALAIVVLQLALPPWLATLIVTAALAFVAVSLLAAARIKFQSALPLHFDQTTRSVKEDIEWIKSGTRSAK
jgi:Flp pilus assembly protein TadB